MIGFKLNQQTVRLARAIGDDYVSFDHKDDTQFFVYYESDDTFEIMSQDQFRKKYGLHTGFKVWLFSKMSDEPSSERRSK